MKPAGPGKHFALAFVIAMVLYVISYTWIEHRRTRNGPWEVTFQVDAAGVPGIVINQAALHLTNVRLNFPRQSVAATNAVLRSNVAREVPFDVPFGQCLFMDPTFQPGTLAFNFFGHEVQLIPRTLTVNRQDIPWQSDLLLNITNRGVLLKPTPPPAAK